MEEEYKKIVLLNKRTTDYWLLDSHYYGIHDVVKFKNLFFSFIDTNLDFYTFYEKNIPSSSSQHPLFVINDIQNTFKDGNDDNGYDDNNGYVKNIMLCMENITKHKHYKHYNMYGMYGNDKISIYLYNNIDKLAIQDNKFIAIPIIYLQIDYFKNFYSSIKPSLNIPFNEKKFCLFASFPKYDETFRRLGPIIQKIKIIGKCDSIKDFGQQLGNESCYHSIKLLNIFNQYKFVLCFENSFTDGYITEKIFNVLFARSVPIYAGPSDKYRYFDSKTCFLDLEDDDNLLLEKLTLLNSDENVYNEYINNTCKINKDFDDENYKEKANIFISNLNNEKKGCIL